MSTQLFSIVSSLFIYAGPAEKLLKSDYVCIKNLISLAGRRKYLLSIQLVVMVFV